MATFELDAEGLDRADGRTLPDQIVQLIRARIESGEWQGGHRLPPEPRLAEDLGVSRGTLRRALTDLREDGVLHGGAGRGTFVTQRSGSPIMQQLSTIAEDAFALGAEIVTRVLTKEIRPATLHERTDLRLAEDELVFSVIRVRFSEGTAFAVLRNVVPLKFVPGIADVDFEVRTLFSVLEDDYQLQLSYARRTYTAVTADPEIAKELGVVPGAALQKLEQLTFLQDARPVEYSTVAINSNIMRITNFVHRNLKGHRNDHTHTA